MLYQSLLERQVLVRSMILSTKLGFRTFSYAFKSNFDDQEWLEVSCGCCHPLFLRYSSSSSVWVRRILTRLQRPWAIPNNKSRCNQAVAPIIMVGKNGRTYDFVQVIVSRNVSLKCFVKRPQSLLFELKSPFLRQLTGIPFLGLTKRRSIKTFAI